MPEHQHDWATMTTGRGIRWQRCVAQEPLCRHGWWERLADWLRGVEHERRFHQLIACRMERMVKGGPW